MKLISRFLFIMVVLGVFFPGKSMATHLTGGEIHYEYIGSGAATGTSRYMVSMTLMRDCNQSTVQFDQTVHLGFYEETLNRELVLDQEVDLTREESVYSCSQGCLSRGIYEKEVTLPTSATGYHIVFQRCCRNNSPAIEDEQGQLFYAFIPPGGTNSNPKMLNSIYSYRLGSTTSNSFSLEAKDTDPGSNTRYSLGMVYGAASSMDPIPENGPYFYPDPEVIFKSGYSSAKPFGNTVNVAVNAANGQLTVDSPQNQGVYYLSVAYEEEINGTWYTTSVAQLQFISATYSAAMRAGINVPLSGSMNEGVAQLNWSDCFPDETGFDIYFSRDTAAGWNLLVHAAANTTAYTDAVSPLTNTELFYKVVPVFDGGTTQGNNSNAVFLTNYPTGVQGYTGGRLPSSYVLTPNPVGNYLHLYFENIPSEVLLYNVVGQVIKTEPQAIAGNCWSFDFTVIPAGTYYVTIVSGDGTVHVSPVVKP